MQKLLLDANLNIFFWLRKQKASEAIKVKIKPPGGFILFYFIFHSGGREFF